MPKFSHKQLRDRAHIVTQIAPALNHHIIFSLPTPVYMVVQTPGPYPNPTEEPSQSLGGAQE